MTKIELQKDKRYALCTCNQSSKYPLCDGVHREYNLKHNTHYKSIKIIPESDVTLDIPF